MQDCHLQHSSPTREAFLTCHNSASMRLKKSPGSLLSALLLESISIFSTATPLSLEADLIEYQNTTIERRCANPCGYYGQVCCAAGEACITDSNNQAQCGGSGQVTTPAAGGNGYWQYYTSTYVETDLETRTSVYSSFMGAAPAQVTTTYCPTSPAQATATGAQANCNWSQGESSCGNICCPQGQYCQVAGQCAGAAGASLSAPLRPTSSGNVVVTQTSFSTTTTVPFQPPVATGQSAGVTTTSANNSGSLSGGAIAGIVIGVIAAIILLLVLCLFCCFRAAWDSIVALFGGRRRRRRETTEVYESYHRSGGGRRGDRRWYGDRPSRIERSERRTGAGLGAAGLGGLAAALGFRRNQNDRRRRAVEEKSDVTSSFGSDSYYTYDSEFSSFAHV